MTDSPENGIYVDRQTFGGGQMLVPIGLLPMYWANWPRGENVFSTQDEADAFLVRVNAALAAQPGLGTPTATLVDLTGAGENAAILIPDSSLYRIFAIAVSLTTGGKAYTSQDYVGSLLDRELVPADGSGDAWPKPASVKLQWSVSEQGLVWAAA